MYTCYYLSLRSSASPSGRILSYPVICPCHVFAAYQVFRVCHLLRRENAGARGTRLVRLVVTHQTSGACPICSTLSGLSCLSYDEAFVSAGYNSLVAAGAGYERRNRAAKAMTMCFRIISYRP